MKRSGTKVMLRLIGLVKPLTGWMILAILMGLAGHLCASGITVLGGYAVLELLQVRVGIGLAAVFVGVSIFAVLRGLLRYGEQSCNHYIAFKLLALLRDRVFSALRRLCPAKLEGRDRGDLIAVITSDIELLEVFYAHTISPIAIAILFSLISSLYISSFHPLLGGIAVTAYLTVGLLIPLLISKMSGADGMNFRTKSGELSSFVLDSLRGLDQTIQYGAGESRQEQMKEKSDALSLDEARLKRIAGRNLAMTNTIILLFDLVMLCAALPVGRDWICRCAAAHSCCDEQFLTGGSFGKPRQYLAKYLCSGKSCAGYFGGNSGCRRGCGTRTSPVQQSSGRKRQFFLWWTTGAVGHIGGDSKKQCDWDCGTKRKWKIDPTQTFYAFLEGTAGQSGNFKCECGCN